MSRIGLVFGVIFLIFSVFCAFKESSITSPYKTFGIYGRLRAFFAFDFTGLGIVLMVGVTFSMLGFEWVAMEEFLELVSPPVLFLCGLISFIVGMLIYVFTYKNCPEDFRGKLIIHMIMTALGVIMKVGFFWLMFFLKIWSYTLPDYITGSDGKKYIRYKNGDIYSTNGKRVGNTTGDGEFKVLKADNGELIGNNIEFK